MDTKSETVIVDKEKNPPPPIPVMALPTINQVKLSPTPQSKQPKKKQNVQNKITGFLPKTSDILPNNGWNAAHDSKYEVATHEMCSCESKSDAI